MSVQRIHLLTLAVCIAIAAAAFAVSKPATRAAKPRLGALGSIPSGAGLAATIDVARLRQSELGAALLAAGRELPGIGRLDGICGFDPSESVRELALATPSAATDAGEIGIVATGDFDAERIARCAEAVIARRSGEPARTHIGSFIAVRDRSQPSGEVAVRAGGPVLLGEGRFLRDMIDATEGSATNVGANALHGALRRRLGDDATFIATWSFDEAWLERATGDELARLSPLAQIRAVGVRVDAAPQIAARAFIVCTAPASCAEVRTVLASLSRDLGPTLRQELGDNPLEGARIELVGDDVHVEVTLGIERAAALLRRAVLRWSTPEPEPRPAQSAPPLIPDEVVRPESNPPSRGPLQEAPQRP